MEIVLFSNGQGMARVESARVVSDTITISFVGAPAFSVLSIIGETRTIRKHLNNDGKCEILVSDLLDGNIRFTLSSKGKIWHVDGIRVERDADGNISIASLVNYAEKFDTCFSEIEKLKETIDELTKKFKTLSADVERYKKDYHII